MIPKKSNSSMLVTSLERSKTPTDHQGQLGDKQVKNFSFLNVFSKKNSNAFGSTQGGTVRDSSKNSTMQGFGRHLMQDNDTRGDSSMHMEGQEKLISISN